MKYQHLFHENFFRISRALPFFIKKPFLHYYSKYWEKKIAKLETPLILTFFVTNRCNLKCRHCFYWKELENRSNELDLEHVKTIANSLNSLDTLLLTGGEPFLRSDLAEICALFQGKAKKINITTNGSSPELIAKTVSNILEKTSLDLNVQVSLDGLEKTHDLIRGKKGAFKNAVKTIKLLSVLQAKHKNFHATILTTISSDNVSEIEGLLEYTEKLGAFHGFQFIRSSSCDTYYIDKKFLSNFDPKQSKSFSVKEMKKAKKILDKRQNSELLLGKFMSVLNDNVIFITEKKQSVLKCKAGRLDGVLYANGDVSLCEFTKPFCNLKEFGYDFKLAWNSNKANKMRKNISNCFCTHTCNLMNSMKYDFESLKKLFS